MLSVIIPTRNRAEFLQFALNSLLSQTLPSFSFEVLVIDNGSTDNTRSVVTSFQRHLDNFRYFFDPSPGLHIGRHLGMKMAKSDILVYADDDIEAFPTWLEAILETFQNSDVALVGGKNLPKFESIPPEWILKMWRKNNKGNRILGYLSILDLGNERKEINPFHVFGCNFSIKKSILLEAGGFHPDAMPEKLIRYRGDGESHVSRYILKHDYKTIYHPKASVYHSVPSSRLSMEYFCRRAYYEGISQSYTQLRSEYFGSTVNKHKFHNLAHYYSWLKKIPIAQLFKSIGLKSYADIHRIIDKSYQNGRQFHQEEIAKDPALLAWVLLENYLNENGKLPQR